MALYRKYRSKSLDEVIGQEHITVALKQAIKHDAISHAYLFTGPHGVGKTSVARILAHTVNDLPYVDESVHLDIIEIDAASNRRIDEIRDLRDKVHIAPTSVKYKVYIIDEVHMLTREAFNALLKTLEEPPAHVIFILATTEAHKLPETITSRAQRFRFKPIDTSKITEHLRAIAKAEKIEINEPSLELIAQHSGGSFRDSISLLDQIRNTPHAVNVEDVLNLLGEAPVVLIDEINQALVTGNASKLIVAIQTLHEQGYEAAIVAKQLSNKLRIQLLNNQAELPTAQILSLLNQLMNVAGASDQTTALEIALLSSLSSNDSTSNSNKIVTHNKSNFEKNLAQNKTPPDQQPEKKTKLPLQPEKGSTEHINKSLDKQVELNDELWQQVVEAIKKRHNTLYSIIRMAQPIWENDSLILTFTFAFHQKRINDPKNRKIIAQTINELSGQVVQVKCILDTSAEAMSATASNESMKNSEDLMIKNISNIFGGAELLES